MSDASSQQAAKTILTYGGLALACAVGLVLVGMFFYRLWEVITDIDLKGAAYLVGFGLLSALIAAAFTSLTSAAIIGVAAMAAWIVMIMWLD